MGRIGPFCLLMLGLIPIAFHSFEGTRIPATDGAILYVGRWGRVERAGRTSMATVSSSSQIDITFTGQHIAGLFSLDGINSLPQIYVRIDNGPWALFTIDRTRIEFYGGDLPQGEHRLEMAVKFVDWHANRWVPPLASGVVFQGLELDSGAAVVSTSRRAQPLIQFFGDSITEGERVLGIADGAAGSDALKTYAWLAGEALGSTHVQIAFGGQGVICPAPGDVPPAILSFAWNFGGSPADFSHLPDFLVINQGANDGPYPSNEFIEAYVKFLQEARRYCPHTLILALRPFGGQHGDDVAEAVRTMADPLIVFVDTTGWVGKDDYTDGIHPNIAGSRKAAACLEEILKPYISNWRSKHTSK